jgi:hypothetical protein
MITPHKLKTSLPTSDSVFSYSVFCCILSLRLVLVETCGDHLLQRQSSRVPSRYCVLNGSLLYEQPLPIRCNGYVSISVTYESTWLSMQCIASSLVFVAVETCSNNSRSSSGAFHVATGACSAKPRPAGGQIAAFRRHVTIL